MVRNSLVLISAAFCVVLVGCGPSPEQVAASNTAIAATGISQITASASDHTRKPSPTDTPVPAETPSPTQSSTPSPSPSPTQSPTHTPTAEPELLFLDDAEAYIVTLSDMPSGFSTVTEKTGRYTNEAFAQGSPGDASAFLRDLEAWGRIDGYRATYHRKTSYGSELVQCDVHVMTSTLGAMSMYDQWYRPGTCEPGPSPGDADSSYVCTDSATDPSVGEVLKRWAVFRKSNVVALTNAVADFSTEFEYLSSVVEAFEARVTDGTSPAIGATPAAVSTATKEAQKQALAANYLGSQTEGGIEMEIIRVLFAPRSWLDKAGMHPIMQSQIAGDTVGMIILRITNIGDKVVGIYPRHATVIIGDEQIDTLHNGTLLDGLENVNVFEMQPGTTRIGGFWFGIHRHGWSEIVKATYIVPGPHDLSYRSIGGDFRFELDLSGAGFEPPPKDLW